MGYFTKPPSLPYSPPDQVELATTAARVQAAAAAAPAAAAAAPAAAAAAAAPAELSTDAPASDAAVAAITPEGEAAAAVAAVAAAAAAAGAAKAAALKASTVAQTKRYAVAEKAAADLREVMAPASDSLMKAILTAVASKRGMTMLKVKRDAIATTFAMRTIAQASKELRKTDGRKRE